MASPAESGIASHDGEVVAAPVLGSPICESALIRAIFHRPKRTGSSTASAFANGKKGTAETAKNAEKKIICVIRG
jgi:hypothetical protein